MSESEEIKSAEEFEEQSPSLGEQKDEPSGDDSDKSVERGDDQNTTAEHEEGEDDEKNEEGGSGNTNEANEKNLKDLEKQEEAKLRDKYPQMKTNMASSLLQKRLSKGNKYFDSGDYNMAKAKVGSTKPVIGPGQKIVLPGPTGDAIPTPETVPHKKISNLHSKLVNTHLS